MKKLLSIMFMAVAMLTFSISTSAQAPTKKQRISREQLAENRHSTLPTTWLSMRRQKVSLLTLTPSARKRYGLLDLVPAATGEALRRRPSSR